jgi:ornithine carbamoyltransferase
VLSDSLRGRDFLRVNDWSADELRSVLDLADSLKAMQKVREPHVRLAGRTVGLVFDKPSTRTRVSFGVGIAQLGAVGLPLSEGQLHLGRGEPISDTARILSLYLDAIVIRTFRQADVDELAAAAEVPVINGLTDEFHPCQALADVMTIRERFGTLEGIRVAYLGDGNNVCHSLMVACAKLGVEFVAATPVGYEPSAEVAAWALAAAAESGGSVSLVRDPRAAAAGADVLYTDVWTSMGQEDESERRLRDLRGYTIDRDVVSLASDRAIVMHCLPAHRGEEITADILEGPRSAVWDQAENRLHTQKALMALVIP